MSRRCDPEADDGVVGKTQEPRSKVALDVLKGSSSQRKPQNLGGIFRFSLSRRSKRRADKPRFLPGSPMRADLRDVSVLRDNGQIAVVAVGLHKEIPR